VTDSTGPLWTPFQAPCKRHVVGSSPTSGSSVRPPVLAADGGSAATDSGSFVSPDDEAFVGREDQTFGTGQGPPGPDQDLAHVAAQRALRPRPLVPDRSPSAPIGQATLILDVSHHHLLDHPQVHAAEPAPQRPAPVSNRAGPALAPG
jgi:hypothetical protein